MWYLSFCLTYFTSMIVSRFIRIAAEGIISLFLMSEYIHNPSPGDFLQSNPTGLQSQTLWGILLPFPES